MAKSDFCFTFYDGDAARDMQHMDRLTRGGYIDLVLSQRKFGALSIDFVKRILGKDFEVIWPQIEIICIKTEDDKFYIEWLEKSEKKAKLHSKHQSDNGKKGGRKPNESQIKPKLNPNESGLKPLEDGDGDVYGNSSINSSLLKPENILNLELPEIKIIAAIEYLSITKNVSADKEMVLVLWNTFKEKHSEEKYQSTSKAFKHFFDSLKYEKIDGSKKNRVVGRDELFDKL